MLQLHPHVVWPTPLQLLSVRTAEVPPYTLVSIHSTTAAGSADGYYICLVLEHFAEAVSRNNNNREKD